MLALQTALITLAVLTAVLVTFSAANEEAITTKTALLHKLNKEFFDKSSENLLKQTLASGKGSCLEKQRYSGEKLSELAVALAWQGVEMAIGFGEGPGRTLVSPASGVEINGEILPAGVAILSCVENGLKIAGQTSLGAPFVSFELAANGEFFHVLKKGGGGVS